MKLPHLNRRFVLERPEQTPDGSGGLVTQWAALGVIWAELRPASARETAGQGLPVARMMFRIIVRGAPQGSPRRPIPGQRLRSGTRIFEVETVAEYDRDARYLMCLTKEEVAS